MSLDQLGKREAQSPLQDRLSTVLGQIKRIEHQMTINHNERLRQLAIIEESISVYKQEEGLKQWIKRELPVRKEANDT